MKRHLKILWVIVPVVLCIFCLFLFIYKSEGYHSFLHRNYLNLDGSCMIYDIQNKTFLDDAAMHIKLIRTAKAGEDISKGQFIIKGWLDAEKLNKEAGKDVFYTQAASFVLTGDDPCLEYCITRHENLGGPEQTMTHETILPKAFLEYRLKDKTAVVKLSYGEQYDEDVRYLAFYGFADREAARKYIESAAH